MSRWHGDGAWAATFDNPDAAEIQLADWQVIDLAGRRNTRTSAKRRSSTCWNGCASRSTTRPRPPA